MKEKEIKSVREIERTLIKSYRKYIWVKFVKAINEYEMIQDGDRIAVAISGGKDSLVLAKCLQELQRHGKMNFELKFIAMDPGYKGDNRQRLEYNCEKLGIPVEVYDSDIFEVADRIAGDSPCYMCARMRRGNLYNKAQELGCNKLALGHHFNDVIETIMMNIIFAGNFKTMMPKLHSDNFEGLELIRPLYYVEEDSIRNFVKTTGLIPLDCSCKVAEKKDGNMRFYVKDLIKDIKKVNKNADINILRSAENVNMGAIVGWKFREDKHLFLENYNNEEKI